MLRLATSLLIVALTVTVAAPVLAQDKGLGLVVQNNIAAMTVDLTPSYAGVKMEGGDGQVADNAVTRYRMGRVKPLQPLSATTNPGAANSPQGAAGGAGAQQAGGPR